MPESSPSLLQIYARNVEYFAFKRGWTAGHLAHKLGVTPLTLNRIRFVRNRHIDPEVFSALLDLFECTPNDLLLSHPEIDYSIDN